MLQASSAFVMALDSDEELPDEEWLAATQADDDTMDEATAKLLHAPTLRTWWDRGWRHSWACGGSWTCCALGP